MDFPAAAAAKIDGALRPHRLTCGRCLVGTDAAVQHMQFITGGTGIVGTHLLHHLTSAGQRVRALARPGSDRSIVERVFRHYGGDHKALLERIEWVEGDLHDMPSLTDGLRGVTHIYHAAALVSFAPGDADELRRINTGGTGNLVNAALETGVTRLCHVSSTASMGRSPDGGPVDEGLPWSSDDSTSAYAQSKYDAELEVLRGLAEGLDVVIANPSVVLGPGLAGRSSMTLAERLRKGSRFHPPGSNGFVDARDVAAGLMTLMERGVSGERYLLVGENRSYRDLFHSYAKAFGNPAPGRALKPWMLALAWRAEALRTFFTRTRPMVTRHTVHSALSQRSYDATKARALGIPFRNMESSVANVAAFLNGGA